MKLRRTTGYALSAIFQLAEANPGERIATRQLAEAGKMPVRFLLQVLGQLAKSDILKSHRGVDGGFALAHPLQEISLLEVIEAIEGQFTTTVPELNGIDSQIRSRLQDVLADANDRSTALLRDTSLESLRSSYNGNECTVLAPQVSE